jgi:SAM-dependent methyltransferase
MPVYEKLTGLMRCPRCKRDLVSVTECPNGECPYSRGFRNIRGQPVLIDFENSIFEETQYNGESGYSEGVRYGKTVGSFLEQLLMKDSSAGRRCCELLLEQARKLSPRPRILVIGGGSIGSGLDDLYNDDDVVLIGSDIYASPHTDVVADGHSLPFRDETMDAICIQAVLEHVLSPMQVVGEIHRVLKPGGIVYADSPFMQQVHEGAYDFTRFTMSGHRWLFRHFSQIDAGVTSGAGTAAIWSLRYLLRSLGVPKRLYNILGLASFPLRFADRSSHRREVSDAASGFYFIGKKSGSPISPKDMVAYYDSQRYLSI